MQILPFAEVVVHGREVGVERREAGVREKLSRLAID
jgi:hypothetical protein